MAQSEKDFSVVALQARWDKIRTANLYDTLDKMGYGNQCLDLGIRPLFRHRHIAGKAITVSGRRDPRVNEELEKESKSTASFTSLDELLFAGCVVVVEGGGDNLCGHFGEMTSWNLKQHGAKGIVLDGMIRDLWGLEVIPDYCACARGTSPIESYPRWRIATVNETIAMPGTLTHQVKVAPGDWIVGEDDGIIVVPQEIAMEVLIEVEDVEAREQGMREDFARGMSFADAFKKWGRA
jgi:4-hydroxy-4-methyl-2-oxoglutarate aldolase